jgi:hypothetical protein
MKDGNHGIARRWKLRWIAFAAVPLSVMAGPFCCAAAAAPDGAPAGQGGLETESPDAGSSLFSDSPGNPLLRRLAFTCRGPATIRGGELITVDPNKRYELTGWFRSVGAEPSKICFGYALFDADKKPITAEQVSVVLRTETTLFAPCKKEDTVLKVAAGAHWQPNAQACVAFEADDSGKYNDLPNRSLSPLGIAKVEAKDDCWQVVLKAPCGRDCPAGTKVREHLSGPAYLFAAAAGQVVPATWTQSTGYVYGVATAGAGSTLWWPGTKYARVVILLNYGQDNNHSVLVSAVSVIDETP